MFNILNRADMNQKTKDIITLLSTIGCQLRWDKHVYCWCVILYTFNRFQLIAYAVIMH
jgi:hypothetical protein